ncbi:Putative tetratricopeptide-like helical domain superfamily [Septoria linicola]|uniref:Tetratricopeptide-like helical domain superfamily n=1 Tax=Septoria linicola TaxID=215465 RepID=A0A9Q9AUP4_9PEZI|nr:putative tetratricopeptide-like helical domain superfamily [Septoria linicola]USW52236.1 Putative tetratricopeptide-like helical domain superfamily [Septoria linicola]
MGARFETWLNRPSTICFLRRVLDTTGCASSTSPACRRYSAERASAHGLGDDDDLSPRRRRYYRSQHVEHDIATADHKRDNAAEAALRASLGPGVDFVGSQTELLRSYMRLFKNMHVNPSSAELVKRLVDCAQHRTDLHLWSELVLNRQRQDGVAGVMTVWKGMRDHGIDLPTVGQDADILWTTFITSGVFKNSSSDPNKLFQEVLQYAARLKDRSGAIYPKLYQTAVATWLRAYPPYAPKWHRYISEHFGEDCTDIKALARDFALIDAFKPFRTIYLEDGRRHRLYDLFIPQLLEVQGIEKTLRWHKLFIGSGDGPGPEAFGLPIVQQLFDHDKDRSVPMIHNRSGTDQNFVVPKDGISLDFPSLTRATMSTLVGEVHGIKRREVSDSFVAKMFATRAFSIDMVISGLGIIGVEKIGPLALRELGLRTGSALEFSSALKILREMGMEISESVYCELMIKLAKDGSSDLFQLLLSSDQHPDTFEDVHTQETLLSTFLEQDDLGRAHVTLTGLSLRSGLPQSRAWNLVLQYYIKQHEHRLLSSTFQQMQALDIQPSTRTLNLMHRYMLPKRRIGKAPPDLLGYLGVPLLQFTTDAYMYSAKRGVRVNPKLWIENMKRYGMLQKWDELERLVLWLVTFYHDWSHAATSHLNKRRVNITLQTIFSAKMREALIVWGFRYAVKRKLLSKIDSRPLADCQPWARGIALLRKLNDKGLHNSGMQTSPELVRRTLKQRLWILFGPGFSTKRINLEAMRQNRLTSFTSPKISLNFS